MSKKLNNTKQSKLKSTNELFELEFIITFNKDMYKSDNISKYQIELIESGKYKPQDIFSIKLSRKNLSEFLKTPFNIVEFLHSTENNFNDILKVSMCLYQNENEIILPKWYEKSNGKIFGLQELYECI